MLCQKAYFRYESRYYRYQNYIPRDDEKSEELIRRLEKDIFEEVERKSKKYGFEKAWYSDRSHYIGIKENMSFYINRRNGIEIRGDIRGENLKEVEESWNAWLGHIKHANAYTLQNRYHDLMEFRDIL